MAKTILLLKHLLFASLSLHLACTVGPDYRRPVTVADRANSYENIPDDMQEVVGSEDFSRWWRRMDDPMMNRYVDQLLEENLQIKEAAARVGQAWARLGIEKGDQLPGLSASAAASRSFQPLNDIGFASGVPSAGGGNDRVYFTRLDAGLSTSWQVDLFGRVRRSVAAAKAFYLASRAEAEALTHALIAELAQRRIALAILKRRLQVVEETVESRKLTLETVERRYRKGTDETSAGDVYLARENLASAASAQPNLLAQLTEEAYALAVLLGLEPGAIDPMETDIPLLPPPLRTPVGIPARLLDRRPDLQAAELRMIAATEEIGVAVANLYPNLTLSGNIGFQNDELENFFDSANLAGAILGDVLVRIFEGGSLRANIDLQEEQARELAADYARQVLNAIEEVEVALSNEKYLLDRLEKLQTRLVNVRKAEEKAWENYRRGLRSLLEVLELQRRRYIAEQERLLAAQAAWNNRIALHLALGGDWIEAEPEIEPFPVPASEES